MKVSVGGSAVLAVVGVGVAAYVAWSVYRKGAAAADAVAELWEMGGQKLGDLTQAVTEQAKVAATKPYSMQAVAAYGGPLNPIGRVAGSIPGALEEWDALRAQWQRLTAPKNTAPAPWLTDSGRFNNPSAYVAPPVTGNGTGYDEPGLPDYFAP